MTHITQERLHELFNYKDGSLYLNIPTHKTSTSSPVGSKNGTGRLLVWCDGRPYLVHRLVFLYHHGFLPAIVDHADNNPLNNSIENLRAASRAENSRNCTIRKDNKTRVKGVYPYKGKFRAHLRIDGKLTYLGSFKTIEEAAGVVKQAREKHHQEFARHE